MPLIDLSLAVETGMPVYPGDPEVRVSAALTLERDGIAVSRLDLGSHTGTHLDAPSHAIAGGAAVDRLPLEMLAGPARVLRLTGAAQSRELLGIARIAGGVPARLPGIVCVATGWDTRFLGPEREAHPALDPELADLLWQRGARVLGVDALSPDPTAAAGASCAPGMPVHDLWLGRGGAIVENLTRLTDLPAEVEIAVLPLRLRGGDGSPVRAVARI